jgi:CBS domain-containing protein
MELARNLRKDHVSRLEPTPPRMVDLGAEVAQAVELMRRESVGCVLVCDREGKLLGLFTERDLMCRVLAVGKSLNLPISEVMTPEPVTVKPKDSIRIAVRTMKSGGYRHLPVVDDERRPVGILSVKRVVHYLVEHYPAAIYNQPPEPGSAPASAEGA